MHEICSHGLEVSQIANLYTQSTYMWTFISCICLSLAAGPLGVFLVLRRMTLMGDALSHGILPGAALGVLFWGTSIVAISMMGMLTGLLLAGVSAWVARTSSLSEDASFAGFYLISMALGTVLRSHSQCQLSHLLFGSLGQLDQEALYMIIAASLIGITLFVTSYGSMIIYCFDPVFFRCSGRKEWPLTLRFIIAMTLTLSAAFQAFGTLIALGIIVLPALTMRLMVTHSIGIMCVGASLLSMIGIFCGFWISQKTSYAWGASTVLLLGMGYLFSVAYACLIRKKS